MRKIFLKKSDFNKDKYWIIEEGRTINFDLKILKDSFNPRYDWIEIEDEGYGHITVWSRWEIKDRDQEKSFADNVYNHGYRGYFLKRYDEMPKLMLTQENYDQVKKEYKKMTQEMTDEYVVIQKDDTGKVSIKSQQKLSQEDEDYIKKYLAIYEKFVNKLNVYRAKHAPFSRIWRSQKDSEFYSDFLTLEEMVWKK